MSALSHLRVLDLSRILAGPWASQMLADLGADVLKIEKPDGGDDTRRWGPPFLKDRSGQDSTESAYYLCTNRGKRSQRIDIRSPEGQARIHQLVKDADVVVENFKVGNAAKYAIDYPTLNAINPRLVYCSISGFGQTGPYKDRAGYDFLVQAMGGLMSVTGETDDVPGGGPQKVGVALSDIMTGLYATVGILAALAEREQSGLGQYIDLALLDVTAATLANQASNYLVGGQVPARMGNAHPNIVPYQSFLTASGYMILAIGNDEQFKRFSALVDQGALSEDPRYASNPLRVKNRDSLAASIQQLLLNKTRDQWLPLFAEAGIPTGPINTIDEVFADPQIKARQMRVKLSHPLTDELEVVANPLKLSRSPVDYSRPPPLLGEHDNEGWADYTQETPVPPKPQ